MSWKTLEVERQGAVLRVWLNRPERRNALNRLALEEIEDCFTGLQRDFSVRVLILAGRGKSFCAGADRKDPPGISAGSDRERRYSSQLGLRACRAIAALEAVTLARVHGHAVGGGFALAVACDFRLASEDTLFSIPEVDLGIPLAWGGIPRLVREIGPALTKELVLTCRPFDATEAKATGFLNQVVPAAELEASVLALARSLTSKASHALFSTKRHVNAVTDQMVGTMRSWTDADGLVTAFGDPECAEARRNYLRKRSAKA